MQQPRDLVSVGDGGQTWFPLIRDHRCTLLT